MAFWNLMGKLGIDTSQWEGGMKRAQSQAVKFGSEIRRSFAGFFTVGAFTQLVRSTIAYSSHLVDLAARLGISTTALQEWNFAAKQTGATVDDVAQFFEKLAEARAKAIIDPTGPEATAFARFKVGLDQLKDLQNVDLGDIAKQVADVFKTDSPQAFIDALKKIGGKGVGGLIPAFTEGISEAAKEAARLGLIINPGVLDSMDDMGDKLDILTLKSKSLTAQLLDMGITLTLAAKAMGTTAVGPGWTGRFIDNLANDLTAQILELERRQEQRRLGRTGMGPEFGGGKPTKAEGIFKPGGTQIPLLEFMKAKKTDPFTGIPSAGGTAGIGGFFLGADAALRSIPSKQLDALESIDQKITNIERVVTEDGGL